MTDSKIYVIGTGLSAQGSVCLLVDGRLSIAIEKERLTGQRGDGGNDRLAMEYVLDRAGITLDDVAVVVQNENFGIFTNGNSVYDHEERLLALIGDNTRVVTISHHLAHAYSAFGPSGFDEAAVLVAGDCGNSFEDCTDITAGSLLGDVPAGLEHLYYEKDSYYRAEGGNLAAVAKDFSPWGPQGWPVSPPTTLHSLAGVYRAFGKYIFGDLASDEKIASLAPYGKPGRFDGQLYDFRDGRVLLSRDALAPFTSPATAKDVMKSNFDYYADVAYWVQRETEEALLRLVRDRFDRYPSRNLAYAGEAALNAAANACIAAEGGFERVFIQPAAGDNGLAIGCAYYGWHQVLGCPPARECRPAARVSRPVVYGAAYPADRIGRAVEEVRQRVRVEAEVPAHTAAARLLADGKVIAVYQGGAELGTAATGHRCLVAHPGRPEACDRLRDSIKSEADQAKPDQDQAKSAERWSFFAFALKEEGAACFVDDGHAQGNLGLLVDVRPRWRSELAGVTRVDGRALVQLVSSHEAPELCQLLSEFRNLTGLPVLLAAPLGQWDGPPVETPEQTLSFFLGGGADALVLEDSLLVKAGSGTHRPARKVAGPGRLQPSDVPVLGRGVAGVGLNYELTPGVPDWLQAAEVEATVQFAGSSRTITLPQHIVGLLSSCDGQRTYADIAAQAGIPIGGLLQIADSLGRRGVLEHRRTTPA